MCNMLDGNAFIRSKSKHTVSVTINIKYNGSLLFFTAREIPARIMGPHNSVQSRLTVVSFAHRRNHRHLCATHNLPKMNKHEPKKAYFINKLNGISVFCFVAVEFRAAIATLHIICYPALGRILSAHIHADELLLNNEQTCIQTISSNRRQTHSTHAHLAVTLHAYFIRIRDSR